MSTIFDIGKDFRILAKEKIDKELKEFEGDKYGKAVYTYVANAIREFCDKNERFAEVVYKTKRSLSDCISEIMKGCGKHISDIEVYRRAALEVVNKFFKGYSDADFTVRVPKDRLDFVREGQELSHCVGSERYYNNHNKGTSMIFFIRRADDPSKAFFTAEIDMTSFVVIQLYGYGDCTAPKEVTEFTKKFARYLKQQCAHIRKSA